MSTDLSLQPPSDGISSVSFSSDSSRLLVSSWDSTIQLHHLVTPPQPPQILAHPAAVLTACFGSTPTVGFSGGLDKRVRQWNFETGQCIVLGKHDDAVSSLVWCPEFNVLISASWDRTIKVWDPSARNPLRSTQSLPERAYNLSYSPATSILLISMAHRHVRIYSLPTLAATNEGETAKVEQDRESALKFLTRSIATSSDGKGWVAGSIEGRISVEYLDKDPSIQAQKYAFRAHRQTIGGVDQVYPINAIAYHPTYATFASGGSDGAISIWDQTAKKRMKLYAQYPTSISSLAFSPDGKKLAIGASYEHDNGVPEADRGAINLYIKDTMLEDCKPKAKA